MKTDVSRRDFKIKQIKQQGDDNVKLEEFSLLWRLLNNKRKWKFQFLWDSNSSTGETFNICS